LLSQVRAGGITAVSVRSAACDKKDADSTYIQERLAAAKANLDLVELAAEAARMRPAAVVRASDADVCELDELASQLSRKAARAAACVHDMR
jgi:hypothetical protein